MKKLLVISLNLMALAVIAMATLAVADSAGIPIQVFPATTPSMVPPSSGFGDYVRSQGGFPGFAVACVLATLAALTALHEICLRLKLSEPGWVQKSASLLATVLKYLTANSPPEPKPNKDA